MKNNDLLTSACNDIIYYINSHKIKCKNESLRSLALAHSASQSNVSVAIYYFSWIEMSLWQMLCE